MAGFHTGYFERGGQLSCELLFEGRVVQTILANKIGNTPTLNLGAVHLMNTDNLATNTPLMMVSMALLPLVLVTVHL